jgi:threonylcarbamoyladenosine tRNA methylthiotransferase MtaB
MSKKTYKTATLGCRTNQYETQAYQAQLESLGYREVSSTESADICIVNTCTVTQSADSSSRLKIRQLRRDHPASQIVVTGCMSDQASQLPEVDLVVDNLKKEELIEKLFPNVDSLPEFAINRFEAHTRAFVKVQDGCNSYCTYCIIPYVRGRSRSRGMDEILREVEGLVANGYKEIVLTGINIGDFDGDGKRLSDLIRAVDGVSGVERIRVSSIDPDEIDDDLSDAILNGKNTCKSMHIVLQAGSNVVLKRMNRKYTRQLFLDTVHRLTTAEPDFTVTTDIIVGFPGEAEVDFEETLEVMEQVQFAKVHMFPYSDRERTRANLYPNKVANAIKKQRKRRLLQIAERQAYALRDRYKGRKMTILTEGSDAAHPGQICGHTGNFLMVWVPSDQHEKNELIEVELLENRADGLMGRILDKQKVAS